MVFPPRSAKRCPAGWRPPAIRPSSLEDGVRPWLSLECRGGGRAGARARGPVHEGMDRPCRSPATARPATADGPGPGVVGRRCALERCRRLFCMPSSTTTVHSRPEWSCRPRRSATRTAGCSQWPGPTTSRTRSRRTSSISSKPHAGAYRGHGSDTGVVSLSSARVAASGTGGGGRQGPRRTRRHPRADRGTASRS